MAIKPVSEGIKEVNEEWPPLPETSAVEPPALLTQEEAQPPVPDILVDEEGAPVSSPAPGINYKEATS